MTQADVQAVRDSVSDADVTKALNAPVAVNETAQRLDWFHERLSELESIVQPAKPWLAAAVDGLETSPATKPVVDKIEDLARTLNALLATLGIHFGDKIGLPDKVG